MLHVLLCSARSISSYYPSCLIGHCTNRNVVVFVLMVATDQFACEHSTVHKCGFCMCSIYRAQLPLVQLSNTNSTNVSTCKVLVLKIVMFPMKHAVTRTTEGKQVKGSS